MSTRFRGAVAAAALAVTILAGACSDDEGDDGDDASSSTSTSGDVSTTSADLTGDLPPKGALALEALYGDALEELGMKLTPRGGLIDRSNGGYVNSADGQHLALYVEPMGRRTTQQFVDGILDITTIFAPDAFERWPELQSFDVCQEPVAAFDPSPEPLPITQIELTRAQVAAIDWDTVTIADLVNGSRATPPTLRLALSSTVSGSAELAEALADA